MMNKFYLGILAIVLMYTVNSQSISPLVSFNTICKQSQKAIANSDISKKDKQVLNQLLSLTNDSAVKNRIKKTNDTVCLKIVYNRKTKNTTLDEIYKSARFINGINSTTLYENMYAKEREKDEAESYYYEDLEFYLSDKRDSLKDVMNKSEKLYLQKDKEYQSCRDSIFYYNSLHKRTVVWKNGDYEMDYFEESQPMNSIGVTVPVFIGESTHILKYTKTKKKIKSHFYVIEFKLISNSNQSTFKVFVPKKTKGMIESHVIAGNPSF